MVNSLPIQMPIPPSPQTLKSIASSPRKCAGAAAAIAAGAVVIGVGVAAATGVGAAATGVGAGGIGVGIAAAGTVAASGAAATGEARPRLVEIGGSGQGSRWLSLGSLQIDSRESSDRRQKKPRRSGAFQEVQMSGLDRTATSVSPDHAIGADARAGPHHDDGSGPLNDDDAAIGLTSAIQTRCQ